MNTPYVKQYDENGTLTNPIKECYLTGGKNRRQRRMPLGNKRFHGESNNCHLTVTPTGKYKRVRQLIKLASGKVKTIEHYI